MSMGGELAHVRPYLRDQDLRCPAVYPWEGVKELYLLRERGDHLLYLHAQLSNGLLKVVDVSQHPANHEAVVSAESPFQCFPQSRDLRAKAAPSQLRQYLRSGGAANERICSKALPETPSARVATEESFIPASWSTFSRRWTSLANDKEMRIWQAPSRWSLQRQ